MQVDEAGGDDKARCIQRRCPRQRRLGQHHDLARLDADMTDCIEPRLWVDYATACNDEIEGRRVLRGRGRHEGKQEQDGKQQTHESPRFETVSKTTYLRLALPSSGRKSRPLIDGGLTGRQYQMITISTGRIAAPQ